MITNRLTVQYKQDEIYNELDEKIKARAELLKEAVEQNKK
jgi:hypothetical protein